MSCHFGRTQQTNDNLRAKIAVSRIYYNVTLGCPRRTVGLGTPNLSNLIPKFLKNAYRRLFWLTLLKQIATIAEKLFYFCKKILKLSIFTFYLFLYLVFSIHLTAIKCSIYIQPKTGFEPRTSGIGSRRIINYCATTTFLL